MPPTEPPAEPVASSTPTDSPVGGIEEHLATLGYAAFALMQPDLDDQPRAHATAADIREQDSGDVPPGGAAAVSSPRGDRAAATGRHAAPDTGADELAPLDTPDNQGPTRGRHAAPDPIEDVLDQVSDLAE